MKASQRKKSETKVIQFKQWNRNKFTGDAYANNRNQFSTQGKFHIKASTKHLWLSLLVTYNRFCNCRSPGDTWIREFRPSKTKQKVMLFSKKMQRIKALTLQNVTKQVTECIIETFGRKKLKQHKEKFIFPKGIRKTSAKRWESENPNGEARENYQGVWRAKTARWEPSESLSPFWSGWVQPLTLSTDPPYTSIPDTSCFIFSFPPAWSLPHISN